MFSGKSTYALSWIRRQRAIGKKVTVIKPDTDKRYTAEDVLITHNLESIPCVVWKSNECLNPFIPEIMEAECVVIDETQFLCGIKDFIKYAVHIHHKHVLIVGLDGDAKQRKFGEILDCIPLSTTVTKLNALCSHCNDGTPAPFCQRREVGGSNPQIDVGGSDKYEAVCLKHLSSIE
jgi:thymidine kinase